MAYPLSPSAVQAGRERLQNRRNQRPPSAPVLPRHAPPIPRPPSLPRISRALRACAFVWADETDNPYLSLVARLPLETNFVARVAPYTSPTSSHRPVVVAYRVRVEIRASVLVVREVSLADGHIVGVYRLAACRVRKIKPCVVAIIAPSSASDSILHRVKQPAPVNGIILELDESESFNSILSVLTKATQQSVVPDLGRFQVLEPIGTGNVSKVFLVKDRTTNEKLAMKVISRQNLSREENDQARHRLIDQRVTMQLVRGHPFVLDMRHAFMTDSVIIFVFEYCAGADLFRQLRVRQNYLTEKEAAFLVAQVVLAMEHVHSAASAVFRGLRPDNILIDAQGWIRTTDFGLCKTQDEELLMHASLFRRRSQSLRSAKRMKPRKSKKAANKSSVIHTVRSADEQEFMFQISPYQHTEMTYHYPVKPKTALANSFLIDKNEMSNFSSDGEHNTSSQIRPLSQADSNTESDGIPGGHIETSPNTFADFWNLGVLTHFALTGEFPFEGSLDDENLADSAEIKGDDGISATITSEAARDFIRKLLHKDPKSRLGCGSDGMTEIKQHPWLANIKWKDIERREGISPLKPEKFRSSIDLLDFEENDIREIFHTPAIPNGREEKKGLHRSKGKRRSKIFSREAKDESLALVNVLPMEEHIQRTQKKQSDTHLKVGARQGETSGDGFVFGFGFSKDKPGFSGPPPVRAKVQPVRQGQPASSVLRTSSRSKWLRKARA